MPPVRLGPNDLLEYDVTHSVIVCRECQYAIQKSALQSHLLRHKIFRHERHSLLSLISQLEILEPEDVPLPPPTSKPIAALPVISGFRCGVGPCESLCASSKRMRRHQLECHDLTESEADGADFMVRPVSLQTFFRGTKIRYFEVAGPATRVSKSQPTSVEAVNIGKVEQSPQMFEASATSLAAVRGIDLHQMGYLHHFLLDTSLTLPVVDPENSLYWHHEFVAQALQQEWLMAGLLALAASHKATLAHATSIATAHHERSLSLFKDYQEGLEVHLASQARTSVWPVDGSPEIVTSPHLTMVRGKPTPRHVVLKQLASVISCAHALFPFGNIRLSTLEALITSIRGLGAEDVVSKIRKDDAFGRAAELMEMEHSDRDPVLAKLLAHISSLPSRMADPLGRPQGPEGVRHLIVALSSIATLIDSCLAGFESETDEGTLSAMATWLAEASDDFNDMMAHNNPAALIVLAHWAGSLVKRVEENGCWFLKGASEFILTGVRARLLEEPAILELVDGL
ncbi:hypothetical protein E8E12_003059 [Didymella heteroderae]|uniref:C2H2-type domain-containing protein n=1 Tax=Didymella heteroderae TaxID=1769908 RepID=A0A9P4WJA9_9PLEO|nr:hypothetical protein E8E12_003059 [Didymella heteroderae]